MQWMRSDAVEPVWLQPINRWREFNSLKFNIYKDKGMTAVYGLSESQKCHLSSGILYPLEKTCLYITYNDAQAQQMYEDFKFFYGDRVVILTSRDISFYNLEARSKESAAKRLLVFDKLISKQPVVIVASIEAALFYLVPPHIYAQSTISITVGDEYPLDEIIEKLVVIGYERVSTVEGKGQFSVRGGILDVYPLSQLDPVRLEFFDDEVDSIRKFDVMSQISIEKCSHISIPPACELILDPQVLVEGRERIYKKLIEYKAKRTKEEISLHLEEKIGFICEELEEQSKDDGLLPFFTFFYPQPSSIFDYLDDESIIVLDDPPRIKERYETWVGEFTEDFKKLLEEGEVLPDQAFAFLQYNEFIERCGDFRIIILQSLPRDNPDFKPNVTYQFMSRTIPAYHGKLGLLIEDVSYWKSKGYSIILLTGNTTRGKGLMSSLMDNDIPAFILDTYTKHVQPGQVALIPGTLSKGFEYIDAKFVIVSDKEIYGVQRKRQSMPKKSRRKLDPFTDLKVGDYVVHESHGIGKYLGIEKLVVDGQKRDYLLIQYAGTDRLYIPTDQMDMIQPYIGMGETRPKISKLGGVEWQKAKAKATQSAKKLAAELIKLYAARQTAKGFQFSADTDWQRQFEEMFPYEETEDQLRCIQDVKKDMESPRVMDRLVCGDVGYGKTEVAIRAAFKAVMDGKQVAILAPTTILAQQHYNTLVRRFEDFPFKVAALSRFRSKSEQREILRALKEGNVDVIVGTHRILGKDVKFKDLGLLIIDEEQRFGVSHKEAIKQLKKNIDVLTLTATPIPRTLHMALVGIRDISIIETPPEDRYPVNTYVVEYNRSIVRDAVLREINRGGQVYFIYNKVRTMDKMLLELKQLLPELEIGMAHGQMGENMLEKTMMDFYEGQYDVLVCSTIVENGLNIPNVNTIIVYDADYFGLSQLYQLRGRVGRSNRRAYAYFMYRRDKVLNEIAEKRLKAIKEFTEFGAGFRIAMRDLEIRGSGNILGREQHGHMAAVGYDLYCKLLEQAVSTASGEQQVKEVETSVDIKVDAYIDSSYIPQEGQKIELYKRIAAITNIEDKRDVEDELIDRFGDMPIATQNLIDIAYIKALAKSLGIGEVIQVNNEIKLKPADYDTQLDSEVLPPMSIRLKKTSSQGILKEVVDFLEQIKHLQKH